MKTGVVREEEERGARGRLGKRAMECGRKEEWRRAMGVWAGCKSHSAFSTALLVLFSLLSPPQRCLLPVSVRLRYLPTLRQLYSPSLPSTAFILLQEVKEMKGRRQQGDEGA